MRAFKRLLILVYSVLFGTMSVQASNLSCPNVHQNKREAGIDFLVPKKTQVSNRFFRSTYDYQVVGARRPHDTVVALGKKVSSREMIQTDYDHGDFVVQVRTPKNWIQTRLAAIQPVQNPNQVKALLDNVPISGGIANQHELKQSFDELFQILNFVFTQYKKDKNWPLDFYQDLARWAFRYFFQSTYITVRQKTADGKLGPIVGTVRLITAPYRKASEDWNHPETVVLQQSSNWDSIEVRNGNEFLTDQIQIPEALMQTFWKEIFPKGFIEFENGRTSLFGPETKTENGLTYVMTPMEAVLKQAMPELRPDAGSEVQNLIEPGNFRIDKEFAAAAAPLLYFHMARLSQAPHSARSMGLTSRVLTYAEKGSDTHRYYQSLGLSPQVEKLNHSPTDKPWEILGGGPESLIKAFKKRFARNEDLGKNVDSVLEQLNKAENDVWIQKEKEGLAPGSRDLGFSHQDVKVNSVEKLFQIKDKKNP